MIALLFFSPATPGGRTPADDPGGEAPSSSATTPVDDSGADRRPAAAVPRTEGSDARHTNRLIDEPSPYLRQHAHNPVDWYPWGPEALARARDTGRPIFLSIGYSTCHWCHVMARESFESERIAALLNEHFVAIKVDREERPDLDQLYMTAVQAMTGSGGWPLTAILTPAGEPFFGGTYFPPDDRGGRPGLETILRRVIENWQARPVEIREMAGNLTSLLRQHGGGRQAAGVPAALAPAALDRAYRILRQTYDSIHGGFGGAPKFPTPHQLDFLLRYGARAQRSRETSKAAQDALVMVRGTLDAMAAGGIHDHLGGGFHRYSSDRHWRVPHFEKMLYDQAGLARAYTDAYLVTQDPFYARIARGILDYVLARLRAPGGGFYSAEDADSEGREGSFYVWTAEEIDAALGPETGRRFRQAFGITAAGNWEGTNVLYRPGVRQPLDDELAAARDRLRRIRDQRPRPHRDEKIIVAWNGFMIGALAHAGSVLEEPRYLAAAAEAAGFIEEHLWVGGRLRRHFHERVSDVPAYLDDYAFLGHGLLALYEASFDHRYLQAARQAAGEMRRLFEEPEGDFRFLGRDAEPLIAPPVDIYDGALPSGNAVASLLLQRLGHLLGEEALETAGRRVVQAFHAELDERPTGHLALAAALDFALGPVREVVIAGPRPDPGTDALISSLHRHYLPNAVRAWRPAEDDGELLGLIPFLASQPPLAGRPTAYVCENYACQLPVHTAGDLSKRLNTEAGQ